MYLETLTLTTLLIGILLFFRFKKSVAEMTEEIKNDSKNFAVHDSEIFAYNGEFSVYEKPIVTGSYSASFLVALIPFAPFFVHVHKLSMETFFFGLFMTLCMWILFGFFLIIFTRLKFVENKVLQKVYENLKSDGVKLSELERL